MVVSIAVMLVKWIHVLAASIWVGGVILTVFINRGLRRRLEHAEAIDIVSKIGEVMGRPMRLALYIAMATGIVNLLSKGITPQHLISPEFYQTQLGSATILKGSLTILVLLAASYHTSLGRKLKLDDYDYPLRRRKLLAIGWASLIITLAVTILGTVLRYS